MPKREGVPSSRGRFAPSPTGALHLGNARTALLAWLAARHARSSFVMRVEDLDGPRVRPGLERELLEELAWLGLDWDEGPDVGGPVGPYRQSERLERYAAALERLRAMGLVYPCFCSRAEVAAAARAPHGPGDDGPRYPGTCRGLSPAEMAGRRARRAPGVAVPRARGGGRVRRTACTGDAASTSRPRPVTSWWRGPTAFAAYQLAVVVDDAAMAVEQVVRGDDLLPSTARQILLYRALGAAEPRFAHVPLVVGEDGARLAKRHGAASLGELRQRGCDPRAVVGLLAQLSGLDCGGMVHPRDLVEGFALERIPTAAAVLEPARIAALLPVKSGG